ncbi:MAG TPA: TetR/AcrR family transcriptional regulator [Anaerolineaceae bacterium]|nr:TetR/AcrR family transcriptional regulator [Anaerolineaceae bacterium]
MEPRAESRTERKKEETLSKIITVSVDLFNRYGIDAVTMEQIAEEADIARGTLYNYLPSKEAIINAYLQRTFRQHGDERLAQIRQLPDTRARLTHIFSLLVSGVQAQKQIFEAFMVYRMKQVLSFRPVEGEQTSLAALIHEIISRGQQEGDLRTDLPAGLLAELFEFALIEAIKPFYLDPEHYDPHLSIEQAVDLFLHGAKA